MTEYRREDGLIRAGFALNAWHLIKHYQELTLDVSPSARYEATLSVCVLQSMLANCLELFMFLGRKAPRMLGGVDAFAQRLLNDPEVEVTNTFPGEVDGRALVEHVRNALSHPRMKVTDAPSTGYVTVEDGAGLISRIQLTDSPDVNFGGNLRLRSLDRTGGDLERVAFFTIEMPIRHLTDMAEEIALVLAQPVMGNWESPELVPLPLPL